ncbi:MAG: aminoglycoside 3'-phosphotransferase [Defluviitaleaceae bacterium]|nr:aminoglycoside 3'-phosphotransferase [Defluviitaleaceae bacterium]
MFDLNRLPEKISKKIAGLSRTHDDVGMSDSTILIFDEMVLKIEKASRSSEHEKLLLGWLDGKLPVPKIIEAITQDGYSFLLMSRLPGEMACADNSLHNIEDTIIALAKGLKMLWEINTVNCPCTSTVPDKLAQVKYDIENNLVDMDNFDVETFTTEGFADVVDLYNYLNSNRPSEDLVFSHGDYYLPNIFVSGRDITGFIDLGNGGISDRWQDIALCVRTLRSRHMRFANQGEEEYQKYKSLLFKELGIEPDEEKIRYFILLYEFF